MNANDFENLLKNGKSIDAEREFLPEDEDAVRHGRLGMVERMGISSSIKVDEHCFRRN